MRSRLLLWLAAAIAACGTPYGQGQDGSSGTVPPGTSDAGTMCDPNKPFETPTRVESVSTSADEGPPHLSDDERTIFFNSDRGDGGTEADLYFATRSSVDGAFGPALRLALSSPTRDLNPSLTADGLQLFYEHWDAAGNSALLSASRATTTVEFGAPSKLLGPVAEVKGVQPAIRRDGQVLYFTSVVGDIYRAALVNGIFEATALAELNTSDVEARLAVSADEKTIYFGSLRSHPSAKGSVDIYVATRPSTDVPFGNVHPVTEINTTKRDYPGWLSPDLCRLYLSSNDDVYLARRAP